MTKMKQKEAVFQAISNVMSFDNICSPTKEQRAQVNAILVEGFEQGKIELSKEYNPAELKSYVSGLQSNWLKKDTRLNGGTKYSAKNPGSRAGGLDPELKAMRALLAQTTGESDRAEIQGYIDAKVATLPQTKKQVSINYSALPAELQAKFSK